MAGELTDYRNHKPWYVACAVYKLRISEYQFFMNSELYAFSGMSLIIGLEYEMEW